MTKLLSVNNVFTQFDCSERDDRRGQLIESEEAPFEFLVPHEQLAKASEPAMRHCRDPSPGSLRRIPALLSDFLSAPFDVRDNAMFLNDVQRRPAGVACIGTQVLVAPRRRSRTLDHAAVQDLGHLADIMSVGAGHDERQRDDTPVHQQVAVAAIVSPDPSGWARPRPESAALSAWPPSILCQHHTIPSASSYSANPARHKASKTPAFCHSR